MPAGAARQAAVRWLPEMSTTADIIETLIDWQVDTIFGLPGDSIMEALRIRQDRIRFTQTHHEVLAAFMACAYAK